MKDNKTSINIEFKKEITALCTKRLRIACLIGLLSIPTFGFLDKIIIPEKFALFMTLRIFEVIFVAILVLLSYSEIGKRIPSVLAISGFLSVGIIFCIMIKMNGGHTSTYYAGLNLIILTMALIMPWSLRETGFVCFLIYLFYLLSIISFQSPKNIPILINNNMFFLCTIVIALTASYLSAALRFQEFKGRYELKKAMETLKFITLGLGHEIKNPLAPIRIKIEQLKEREDLKDDAFIQKLTTVVPYEIDRITRLLGQLKEFAAPSSLNIEQINISDLLNDRLNLLKEILTQRNIQLIKQYSNFSILGDRDKLGQVFLNLFQKQLMLFLRVGL